MNLLIIGPIVIVITFFIIYKNDKSENEKRKEWEEFDKKWLEKEKAKPRSYVQIVLKNGDSINTDVKLPNIYEFGFREFTVKQTSRIKCHEFIEHVVKKGVFIHESKYFPINQIESMKILEKQ